MTLSPYSPRSMNPPRRTPALLLVLAAFAAAALGGCVMQSPKDSSISWDKPSGWENTLPGMQSNAH